MKEQQDQEKKKSLESQRERRKLEALLKRQTEAASMIQVLTSPAALLCGCTTALLC